MSYCGIGKIPKGKKRGTAEECIKANQIRYYGLEKIDMDTVNKAKKKKPKTGTYIQESIKLINLRTKARVLVEKIKTAKVIIESEGTSKAQKNEAKRNLDSYYERRPKLIKKIKDQQKVVESMKPKEDKPIKKKPVKKSVNKVTSKSGSKVSKKKK